MIPKSLFESITQKAAEEYPYIVHGWLFADRKENFGICKKFTINPDINIKRAKKHKKPRSWMRYKKSKLYNMRKFKSDQDVDIVWQWHSHPSNKRKLHKMDKKILKYMSHGVMIIVIPENYKIQLVQFLSRSLYFPYL
ncbi:MAG: hypothetical protein P8Y97_09520 [Candidatus Lokiarchaeota archaeon]